MTSSTCPADTAAFELVQSLGYRQVPVVIAGEQSLGRVSPGHDQRARLRSEGSAMGGIVYFSSRSENTHRFVSKLGLPSTQIPVSRQKR